MSACVFTISGVGFSGGDGAGGRVCDVQDCLRLQQRARFKEEERGVGSVEHTSKAKEERSQERYRGELTFKGMPKPSG
jgi:hypothetical protein